MAETALADPKRTQESKDTIQFVLRFAESSTLRLDAGLHSQRYDPDDKLIDMEGPPTAEQLRQDLWDLYAHAMAFLELGSQGIYPTTKAYFRNMQTKRAREQKAANDKKRQGDRRKLLIEIAAAIRTIAADRETPTEHWLKNGNIFVEKYLLEPVNKKLANEKLPPAKRTDIRAAIKEIKGGTL